MAPDRSVFVGRERLRQILKAHKITFQRTRTWKESTDPDFEAKLSSGCIEDSVLIDSGFRREDLLPIGFSPVDLDLFVMARRSTASSDVVIWFACSYPSTYGRRNKPGDRGPHE